jgi:hypothetical protein
MTIYRVEPFALVTWPLFQPIFEFAKRHSGTVQKQTNEL